jgi:hypothetical protein
MIKSLENRATVSRIEKEEKANKGTQEITGL